jgi:hypothetical protein
MDAMIERIHQIEIDRAEQDSNGDPQRFPYNTASSEALRQWPASDLAQSIRDHRAAYERNHTIACDGHLYRGFCH